MCKLNILSILFIFLSSCTSIQEQENDIDPNEKSVIGRIMSKLDSNNVISMQDKFNKLEQRKVQDFLFDTALIVATGVVSFTNREDSISNDPINYKVSLSTGETVRVFNHFPYAVGDCVTVFTSKNPKKYPYRMVEYSGKCE